MNEGRPQKIIALVPFKNEAWILPTFISGVKGIADEIIGLDDGSADDGASILRNAGAKVIEYTDQGQEKYVNMSKRRQKLLDAGREALGTHFIWLDADETFSSDFKDSARSTILKLQPGEGLSMRWLHLWKDTEHYLDDKRSPFGRLWKTFVVCDSPDMGFPNKSLSESRTQEVVKRIATLPDTEGVVLHFQFVNGSAMLYKQAWYRCQELLEGKRNPKRINATYAFDYDLKGTLATKKIEYARAHDLTLPQSGNTYSWHKEKILSDFEKYGIEKFEPLDMWRYLPDLKTLFMEKTGRKPEPRVFPFWLLRLNRFKNFLINASRKLYKQLRYARRSHFPF